MRVNGQQAVDDWRHKPRERKAYKFAARFCTHYRLTDRELVDRWIDLPTGWG